MAGDMVIDQARLKKLRLRIDTEDPQYFGLRKLKVRGRDLNALPQEIFQILELEILDLSPERESCIDYRVTNIPIGIGNLVNLRVLMLDTNDLEAVPPEMCLLTQLERLSLSNNRLITLPDGFAKMKNLMSLHVANNSLEKMSPALCELTELRFLDLSDNLIHDIPESVSKLTKLESLVVVYNRLTRLPDGICTLINLRMLWLGRNNIRELPRKFGNLKNLDWGFMHTSSFTLDGNPLTHPPIDVCKKGIQAISQYFTQPAPTHN